MVAFSVAPISNAFRGKRNKDYNLWYRTGQATLHEEVIYPKDGRPFPFMYPPPCAAMLALASLPGEGPFVPLLTAINSAAWAAAIVLAARLAAGGAGRPHPLIWVVPSAVVLPFVHDTYLLGQPNLLLLALMLGAFDLLSRGREVAAGSLIALAAAIKAFPVLALGYLVYRRLWRAAAALVVGLAILLVAAPLPFRGATRSRDDLTTWTRGMVLKYDAGGIAQRPERSYSFKNQSLLALVNRLLRPIPADGEARDPWTVNVATLDFRTTNAVAALAGVGLCLWYVAAMPPRSRRDARSDAVERAMLLLLMLAFSPLAFDYFYVWLLYPVAMAVQLAVEAPEGARRRREAWAWPIAALAVSALAIPWHRQAQAYGNLLGAGLLLLVGLGRALRRMRQSTPA